MTCAEVTQYWYRFKPWQEKSLKEVEHAVIQKVGDFIDNNGQRMPGVIELLHYFKQLGYKIGLATNSPYCLIQKVVRKLHIEHYFDSSVSADFVAKGKPSPDIYLKAALDLLTHPSKCIVFDDSIAGIRAAHAAAMMVVAVPESGKFHDVRFDIADLKIRKLSDFCKQHLAFLNIKAAT